MRTPQVKNWIVTTENGEKFVVLAPTKFLAKLNFRHEHGWQATTPIKSIGLARKPIIISRPVLHQKLSVKSIIATLCH